jgi:hypothetical protein
MNERELPDYYQRLVSDTCVTCPLCGSRTEFSDIPDTNAQDHHCLDLNCGFAFIGLFDDNSKL